jgi:hypothetical protein|tara:strand:- start:343 stop:468 length:126 start_codon:yes stop_codon:yes gene_type:complete
VFWKYAKDLLEGRAAREKPATSQLKEKVKGSTLAMVGYFYA